MFGDYINPNIFISSFEFSPLFATAESMTIGSVRKKYNNPSFNTHILEIGLQFALDVIHEIGALEDNWDGYGSTSISPRTIENARLAAYRLIGSAHVPDVVPNPHGTISLEWESEEGLAYLEIGDSRFSFFMKTRAGLEVLKDGEAISLDTSLKYVIERTLFPKFLAAPTVSNAHIYNLVTNHDRMLPTAA